MDPKLTAAIETAATDLAIAINAAYAATVRSSGSPLPVGLLTPEQAARALAIGRSEVYKLIAANRLRSVKVGRLRRIPSTAIADLIAELEGGR